MRRNYQKLKNYIFFISIIIATFVVTSFFVTIKGNAVEDVTAPLLNSISVNSSSVGPGDVVTLTLSAADDISGINSIIVRYNSPNGSVGKALHLNSEGNYSTDISIREYDYSGMWSVSYVYLKDNAGNVRYVYATNSENLDLSQGDYQVQGTTPDVTPPVVNKIYINKDYARIGEDLILTLEANDDISGVTDSIPVRYISQDRLSEWSITLYKQEDGKYIGTIPGDSYPYEGKITVKYIDLRDKVGNRNSIWNKELYPNDYQSVDLSGGDYTLAVVPRDGTNPIFKSISISNPIGVFGDNLTVTVDADDFFSGIYDGYVQYISPTGDETRIITLESDLNGKYVGTFSINENDAVGIWKPEYIRLRDWNMNTLYVYNNEMYPSDQTAKDLSGGNLRSGYQISYDSQGGDTIPSEIVRPDTLITAPAEPTKGGYTFGGWYKEAEYVNEWNFEVDKVTSDITLYAKWLKDSRFFAKSLTLNDKIAINYYLKLSNADLANNATFTLSTVNHPDVILELSDATQVTMNGVICYKFTYNQLAAKEMADVVTATISVGGAPVDTLDYSITTYASAVLADTNASESLKNVIYGMLNYGSSAQIFFNYNIGNLANSIEGMSGHTDGPF